MKYKNQPRLSRGQLSKFVFCVLSLFIALGVFSYVFIVPAIAATGINRTINFQGKVVNKVGETNITNGTYSFTFKFYDAASGGTQLPSGGAWTETKNLTVTDGVFRTALGDTTPIPTNLNFNSDDIYLDMTFNGETFSTRIRMSAVAYAFNAEKVSGLTVTNTTGTFTLTNAKTLTVNNTLTFSGTDGKVLTLSGSTTLADNSITFGGSETLTLAAAKNVSFADAFSTSGANPITLTTSGSTSLNLPTTGTLLTNTAAANQTITSTQTAGIVLGIADVTNITSAIKGQVITLSGTGAFDQTGLEFNLSGASGTNLNDIVGTGSSWKVSKAGVLTVASCTGCGGGTVWSSIGNPSGPLALTMAANTSTFTYNAATGSGVNLFNLTDTSGNTGTGYLFNLATASTSNLKPFHVSAAGTEALTILANGNVGIGNTGPGVKLDVIGVGRFSDQLMLSGGAVGAAPMPQLTLGSYYDNAGNPSISHLDLFGGQYGLGISALSLNYISGGDHTFYDSTLTSPKFVVKGTSGNVGIGVSNPTSKLQIAGNLGFNQEAVPGAPILTTPAGGVLTGSYSYCVTFVTEQGETRCGSVANTGSIVNKSVHIASIPLGTTGVVTARKIYRSKAYQAASTTFFIYRLVATINDNTTTVLAVDDNVADGAEGIAAPNTNTTAVIGSSNSTAASPGDFVLGGGPWADVRAFGAKCDGSTDDTTAIQNAINSLALTGGVVQLPIGQCVINNTLNINYSSISIRGLGSYGNDDISALSSKGSTIVAGASWVAANPMIKSSPPATSTTQPGIKRITITDMNFECAGRSDIGLQLISTQYSSFRNLYFKNCNKVHMDMNTIAGSLGEATDTTRNEISNIVVRAVDSSLSLTNITAAAALNSGTITVQCTTNCATAFNSGANSLAVFAGQGTPQYINCTGTTATTFTGCTGGPAWSSKVGDRVAVYGPASATAFRLDGSASSNPAGNTSENNFSNLQVLYVHGTAIIFDNSDSNRFYGVALNRGTRSGIGIEFDGGSTAANSSRGNDFFFMDQGPPGSFTTTSGTGTFTGTYTITTQPSGTTGYASSTFNTLVVKGANGMQTVFCTGTTSNTFTGCTGGSGTWADGSQISLQPIQVAARGTTSIDPATGASVIAASQNNNFYELTRENSTYLPSIEPGATLFYQTASRDTSSYQIASGGQQFSNFGTLNISGAFMGNNSYWGDEFSEFVTSTTGVIAGITSVSAHSASAGFGDKRNWGMYSTATTCAFNTAAPFINGVGRINAGAAGIGCALIHDEALKNPREILIASNLPVMQFKAMPSQADANSAVYIGMGNATDGAITNTATAFIGFSNDNAGTLGNTWVGITRNASVSTTVVCTGQTISTTQFALMRVEVRAVNDVRFFVDNDVSNGVNFVECGNGSATNVPTAALAPQISWQERAGGAASNLAIDFYRVWQDDSPAGLQVENQDGLQDTESAAGLTAISGETSVEQADASLSLDLAKTLIPLNPLSFEDISSASENNGLEMITVKLFGLDEKLASLSARVDVLGTFTANSSSSAGSNTDVSASMSSAILNEVNELDSSPSAQNDKSILTLNDLSIDGLATVSADLRVRGNGLIEGILNVIDTLMAKNLIVSGISEFFSNVVFHDDITFEGRPTFNKDTAGVVILRKDTHSIEVNFEREFEELPIINVNITLDKINDPVVQENLDNAILNGEIQYIVTNRTKKGFVVKLSKKMPLDIPFSWTALSVGNKTITSLDSQPAQPGQSEEKVNKEGGDSN